MANTKSAKKRINVIAKKTLRNKMIKSKAKTAVKKVYLASSAGNAAEAKTALSYASGALDRAASRGVLHKNTASRKKSRLAKMLNKMSV